MRTFSLLFLCLVPHLLTAAEGMSYRDPATGIHIVTAKVDLPSKGYWYVDPSALYQNSLGFTYLQEPEKIYRWAQGDRTRNLEERKIHQKRKNTFWRVYWNRKENNESKVLKEPPEWMHIREDMMVHLVEPSKTREIVALERTPLVDDGKHWVLWSNGEQERIEIDHERWKNEGVLIDPEPFHKKAPETFTYTLYAQILKGDPDEVSIRLTSHQTGESKDLLVTIGDREAPRERFSDWVGMRARSWDTFDNRITDIWLSRTLPLYGVTSRDQNPGRRNVRGETATMLGVLGGSAAIRETLQMQDIAAGTDETSDSALSIAELPGVGVKAHSYGELLGDNPGVTVDLAKLCPPDRCWLYAPDPSALEPLLDAGPGWIATFRGELSGETSDQDVLERHLVRLGLNEESLRLLLRSGMLGETAIFLPDLFLLEGTDVTCIARIKNLKAVHAFFRMQGVNVSPEPQTFISPEGHPITWVIREDLMILGTHAGEVSKVLALHDTGGQGSLGNLEEFRYMLTQCGPSPDTQVFTYLSDPFIRRLTGPQIKIAQHRRLKARADLERIHAGALLYQQDTAQAAPSLKVLMDVKYVGPLSVLDPETLTFTDGKASDPEWGEVEQMTTLLNRLPETASPQEAKAYQTYREEYERFWRQFFDPIAVNLEAPEENTYQATVFVLPLINSSIYDQLRGVLASDRQVKPLPRPAIEPPPIAMMSLNPSEDIWLEVMENMSDLFSKSLGMDLPIWEHLGPGVHLGIADSDSILTLGSGELLGLFSTTRNMRGSEMIFIPVIASVFTRPTVLAIELDQPELAREKLHRMPTGNGWQRGIWGSEVSLIRITGQDRWLMRINFENLIFLSFSLELQDGYLVISNQPMTYQPEVVGRLTPSLHHAAMTFDPGVADKTRRAFAMAALDRARAATAQGLGVLSAFHWSGFPDPELSAGRSRELFGFAPVHPSPGSYISTPQGPESDTFGTLHEGHQPALEEIQEPFGLFPVLKNLDVTMQLENEGLRTRITWEVVPKGTE